MFTSQASIEKLTKEVLINITSFLNVSSILQLSLTSKAFRHLITDELVFRRLVERDFYVTEKESDQSWVELYKERSNTENTPVQKTVVEEIQTEAAATPTPEEEKIEEEAQVTHTTQGEQDVSTEHVPMETTSQEVPPILKEEEIRVAIEQDNTDRQTCPHLDQIPDSVNEIKRIIYKNGHPSLCDLCLSQKGEYLNMSENCHIEGKLCKFKREE